VICVVYCTAKALSERAEDGAGAE